MAVPWTSPDLAARYSSHVEELRDFFAMQHLHYGTLEDIATLAARLDASGCFRDDLSSMVRVILLREGGSVPRADLLEIVIVAIAGSDMDEAPEPVQQTVIHPPVQQIFAFLNGVLRKPWNEPPGEERLTPEPLQMSGAQPVPKAAPTSTSAAAATPMHAESEFSEEEDEPRNLLEVKPAAPTPAYARPESVYSRFTTLVAGMHALTTQVPAAASPTSAAPTEPVLAGQQEAPPESAPETASEPAEEILPAPAPAPAPQFARNVVPWPKHVPDSQLLPPILPLYNSAPERSHSSPAVLLPPIPATQPDFASEYHLHPVARLSPSALNPEPAPPSAIHLPSLNLAPKPNPDPTPIPVQKSAEPRVPARQFRIAVVSGVAASLFVAALMVAARHTSSETVPHAASWPLTTPVAKPEPAAEPQPTNVAAEPPASPAAPTPAPAPNTASVAAAHPRHVSRDDSNDSSDYNRDQDIARPWSNIPPQSVARASNPAAPSPSAAASPSQSTISARAIRPELPAPDTARSVIATNLSEEPASARHRTVSSAEMAGKLLFGPRPGYPMLAKIAHIQGQVVVQAVVDSDGTVSAAHVLSGHRLLRGAAVDAALRRHYRPYLVNGRPVEVSTTITFDFGSSPALTPAPPPATTDRTSAYADIPPR